MPIEVAFWDITKGIIEKVEYDVIDSENKLEKVLKKDIKIISDDLMVIGNQIGTSYGKFIDILAVNSEGKLSIIELKKNKTPRDVVAQTLDYASWVQNLSHKEILEIFKEYNNGLDFEAAFFEKFKADPPEELNQEHDILIVSAELDGETERILNYLSDNYNVPINAVFFRYFEREGKEYLSRSWLIDPLEVAVKTAGKLTTASKQEPWNGVDFVCNIDAKDGHSTWGDCQKYGFVSAGGGSWYSKSLQQLFPGATIFCMIPKKGYVGVGKVLERSVPIREFIVQYNGEEKPIFDVPLIVESVKEAADNLENCEYFVRVEWIKAVPEKDAYWEKGMRANQNSAFKLRSEFTRDKLVRFFKLEE